MNSNNIQWIINFHSFQGRADPKIGDSTCKSYQKCSPWPVRVTSCTLECRKKYPLDFWFFVLLYSKNFFFYGLLSPLQYKSCCIRRHPNLFKNMFVLQDIQQFIIQFIQRQDWNPKQATQYRCNNAIIIALNLNLHKMSKTLQI